MASETPHGSHFWFMTIQWHGNSNVTGSYSGVFTPAAGSTRWDALKHLFERVVAEYPDASDGTILAFDIQPNQL